MIWVKPSDIKASYFCCLYSTYCHTCTCGCCLSGLDSTSWGTNLGRLLPAAQHPTSPWIVSLTAPVVCQALTAPAATHRLFPGIKQAPACADHCWWGGLLSPSPAAPGSAIQCAVSCCCPLGLAALSRLCRCWSGGPPCHRSYHASFCPSAALPPCRTCSATSRCSRSLSCTLNISLVCLTAAACRLHLSQALDVHCTCNSCCLGHSLTAVSASKCAGGVAWVSHNGTV